MTAELLALDRQIVLTERDGQQVLWHLSKGWEAPAGRLVAEVVAAFAVPRTRTSAEAAIAARVPALPSTAVAEVVDELRELGVLAPHEPQGIRTPTGRGGLFGAPVLTVQEALAGDVCDVAVVGMPYDVGVTNIGGTRLAPEFLRRTSGAVMQPSASAGGVWDPVSDRVLLEGVRIADLGDVQAVVFTRNGREVDALQDLVAALAAGGRLPVVLGGDHSITLPVVRALAGAHPRLGVLQIDAHSDLPETLPDGDWREHCHHGNFMGWVVFDERVEVVVRLGLRQLEAARPAGHPKLRTWPGRSAVEAGAEAVLADLPDDLAWHVTLDVDALDPSIIRSTGTPVAGGFAPAELATLLQGLCRRRHVVGIDVVELIPSADRVEGNIVCDLLARVMDAATGARGR